MCPWVFVDIFFYSSPPSSGFITPSSIVTSTCLFALLQYRHFILWDQYIFSSASCVYVTYVCIFMCVHTCMHVCTCVCVRVCIWSYVCMYVCVYTSTYVYAHNMYIWANVCVYICAFVLYTLNCVSSSIVNDWKYYLNWYMYIIIRRT